MYQSLFDWLTFSVLFRHLSLPRYPIHNDRIQYTANDDRTGCRSLKVPINYLAAAASTAIDMNCLSDPASTVSYTLSVSCCVAPHLQFIVLIPSKSCNHLHPPDPRTIPSIIIVLNAEKWSGRALLIVSSYS